MKNMTAMALLLIAAAAPVAAQDDVFVVNFPDVQKIAGKVSADEPIPHSAMVRLGERIVAPVARSETGALVAGGVVEAAGFREAVLSLVGTVQGELGARGSIGAVLVPEEEAILQALDEAGLIQLGLDVVAAITPAESYFAQSQAAQFAFPRYRVYFYNTTDRAVSVRLYAYLTH